VGQTPGQDATALRVVASAPGAPDLDTFLLPFDWVRHSRALPWRRRRRASLRHRIAAWPDTAFPAATLPLPAVLPIDILPHQLAPALAIVSGRTTRLLLADPVGLGKTIEAGLVLRELAQRGLAARVLVLTPASLRDQWQSELRERCGIDAAITDRQAFEHRRRDAPAGLPLYRPPGTHVISIDLAKQPDALGALTGVVWDLLIIDEAHLVAGDSARTAAAGALGARARVVLLLSATPHTGDSGAFRRLCAIGRLTDGDPIGLIRTDRPIEGRSPPVTRDVVPSPSAAEQTARRRLTQYLRLLEARGSSGGQLVAVVLRKRALSSASALAASLRHRRAWLEGHASTGRQGRLPFDDAEMEDGDIAQPAVLRELPALGGDELAVLDAAIAAAEVAINASSKLRALVSLLRRSRERAIVFTEYRDTLVMLADVLARHASVVTLHGGLTRAERIAALARFEGGGARLLIATDVAAEGLNLQRSCRLVVHVELPWSPTRIDQRNGRVDRLGQTRQVHVWRLLGDRRHEARVLSALATRMARITRAGLDATLADAAALPNAFSAQQAADLNVVDRDAFVTIDATGIDVAALEIALLRRLATAARVSGSAARGRSRGLPWWALRRGREQLPRGVIFALLRPAAAGLRAELRFVHVALTAWPPGAPGEWLAPLAEIAAAAVTAADTRLAAALATRERALLHAAEAERARTLARWQASLFEQRAARAIAAARDESADRIVEHGRRLAELNAPAPAPVAVAAFLVR
jgi:superfamily II DNA or RNA helicase